MTGEGVARVIFTDLAPRARSKTLDVQTDRSVDIRRVSRTNRVAITHRSTQHQPLFKSFETEVTRKITHTGKG
jgi:hypothetical protein